MEGRTIEKDIRSNSITNDNRRKEAISVPVELRKPCAIRLPIGFFDDDKVHILYGQKNGMSVILLYIMLLEYAAKSNRSGALYAADGIPSDAEMIASLTRMDAAVVKSGLESLQRYGLIDTEGDAISVVGYANFVEYGQPRRRRR